MAHISPPTSPVHRSSPYASPASSPPVPTSSPARSQLSVTPPESSLSGSDSNDGDLQIKRKVCRTTLQRRKRRCLEWNEQENIEGDTSGLEWEEPQNNGTESSASSDQSNSESSFLSSESFVSEDGSRHGSEILSDDNPSDESVIESEPLYNGSTLTNFEALLGILKLFVKEGWSKKSLDSNLKLIKSLLPQPNELPSSSSSALRLLENLTSSCAETEYLYCKACHHLSGSVVDFCNHEDGFDKFYSFPISKQIKHMFEQRSLASAIEDYKTSKQDGYLTDILDGTEYCKIKEHLQNPYDLTLLWNTDGAEMSSSSKQEMWPILCTICEVSPRLRSSFIVFAGVYVGEKKPNMNVYLKPFADSLIELWQNGVSWVNPVSKSVNISKIVAPVLSADAPAKAIVINCKNYNSKFGCNICEQKTKKIALSAEEVQFNATAPARKKKRRKRRFVFQEDDAPLRTGARIEFLSRIAERSGRSRIGIIGSAVVTSIPFLDRANVISAEYLHVVLLGSVKYLLNTMISTRGPWYIGDKLDEMDLFIARIQVPSFVKRLPRGLKYFKYWKGSDFRAFLLYYSLPLFSQYLPGEYFQHWLLLVASIYNLLKDTINEVDLHAAEIMLRSFVRDIGYLYNNAFYTYNMHNLLHLPLLVQRWGPLWATSAFVFESCNGFISQHVHGTKHLGKELINYIKISQNVVVLDNILHSNSLEQKSIPKSSHPLGKALHFDCLREEEKIVVDSCNMLPSIEIYRRAKLFDGEVYTSKTYDETKKRADSFIQFRTPDNQLKYGQILFFLKPENDSLHCLLKVMTITHVHLFCHMESRFVLRHLIPISDSDELIIIAVGQIKRKVLKIGRFLGIVPNSYEINL